MEVFDHISNAPWDDVDKCANCGREHNKSGQFCCNSCRQEYYDNED